jgi:exodeoxyribonuclease V beta subunit
VLPGTRRHDADYLRDGVAAPALTLRLLRSGDGTPLKADASREAATACVAHLHRVLADARGHCADRRQAGAAGRHRRAGATTRMPRVQQALARAGVPAVAAGKQSLFATDEAAELRALLLACTSPPTAGACAALATVLLGWMPPPSPRWKPKAMRNAGIRANAWPGANAGSTTARSRWSPRCAQQAERLLGLLDGERRLTNYLQLGELLQEAATRTLGLHGQIDWLAAQMAGADEATRRNCCG